MCSNREINLTRLESERIKEINIFFDEIHEKLSEVYESVIDEEKDLEDYEIIIKEKENGKN